MSDRAKKAPAGPQTYVVQEWECDEVQGPGRWVDVATLTVPPRTKRSSIVRLAVGQAKIDLPATLRILDATAAESIPVSVKEREPELVIG